MKPLTLSKTFPYLLNFLSTNYNLITYLTLYKEDTKPHINTHYSSLSHPLILKLHHFAAHISKHFHTSPSLLQKYLFLDNTITTHLLHHTIIHYPSFPRCIILKYYHFAAHKHISISFFISLTILLFLESNITNVITQKKKKTPAATISSCIYYI